MVIEKAIHNPLSRPLWWADAHAHGCRTRALDSARLVVQRLPCPEQAPALGVLPAVVRRAAERNFPRAHPGIRAALRLVGLDRALPRARLPLRHGEELLLRCNRVTTRCMFRSLF